MRDKATGRVVALIALVIVVAAALHGYLPGRERSPRQQTAGNPASLAFIVALLGVSLVIIVIAVIARLKDPRAAAPRRGGLPESPGGRAGRPSWRVVLIGLAVIIAWLLMTLVLTRLLHHGLGGHVSTTQATTTPTPGKGTVPPPRPADNNRNLLGYLGASTVLLLVVLVAATVLSWRSRRRIVISGVTVGNDGQPPIPPSGSESLARAAQKGLAEIGDLSREPREAIIACYAAMERELEHIPGSAPQDFDTPTEVLARAVEHHALHADNATQLVNLFAEARFSLHVMNEQHRQVAVQALQLVLAELSPATGEHAGSLT